MNIKQRTNKFIIWTGYISKKLTSIMDETSFSSLYDLCHIEVRAKALELKHIECI